MALSTASERMNGKTATVLDELDPARAAEYEDLLDHLYRHLRAEDRRLIVMRIQGYRTGEIADELGIAPAVLRVRISRLRKRLRKEKLITEWI
jgi:DNA-directed RNA polymerase specialized sigma24 family protein